MKTAPTPYPAINALLQHVLADAQIILGNQFVGMYLDGSLASGDFDQDSDVDFVVVTQNDLTDDLFATLQAMHDHIATLDSWWATQLEGSYLSRRAIRRFDSSNARYPNIERGTGERLKLVAPDRAWDVHRVVLRERGITLAGPAPQTMIDPVTPDDLRQTMREILRDWAARLLADPAQLNRRGYQAYTVLSVCRILYTLEFGTIVSKRVAAHWAQATRGKQWNDLIEQTWEGRHNPTAPTSLADTNGTLEFIRLALAHNSPSENTA